MSQVKVLNKDYLVKQLKAMDADFLSKRYNIVFQVSEMPEASADNADKIYQFIGTTDETYTKGYFYICEKQEDDTYAFVNLATQPVADTYTLKKAETAEEGYFATYNLQKNNENIGDTINIPKDYLLKGVTLETCTEDDKPVEGYKVGDKYFDFEFNIKDGESEESTHIYLLVNDLVDVYTGENGIEVDSDNKISVIIADDNSGLKFDDDKKLTIEWETEDIDYSDWE